MVRRQHWVPEEHPGSGIAHDRFDLFPDFLAVTVDRTSITHRLVFFERAALESSQNVSFQLFALATQRTLGTTVVPPAKEANHLEDGRSLTIETSSALHSENLYHIWRIETQESDRRTRQKPESPCRIQKETMLSHNYDFYIFSYERVIKCLFLFNL